MNANAQRGELELVADGKTYILRLVINAICALETKTGGTFAAVLDGIQQRRMTDARLLIWAALQPKHAAEFETFDQVGDLLDRAGFGGIDGVVHVMTRLLDLNQPPPGTGDATANPRKAQASTGRGSTRKRAGSV